MDTAQAKKRFSQSKQRQGRRPTALNRKSRDPRRRERMQLSPWHCGQIMLHHPWGIQMPHLQSTPEFTSLARSHRVTARTICT
jgi:hypothetical protein